jgi:regulator of sigma E protease
MIEVIVAILGISLLVIVHEGGHYLAARAFGMRVLRFSVGFGPPLFRYQPKGSPTVFQVCAVPFLAYVQIAGMNPAEDVDPRDPELYPNKGVLARISVIFAGPFANYLAASLLIFGLALSGLPEEVPTEPMIVGGIEQNSPADLAGLEPGDVILRAGDREIANVNELIEVTTPRAGKPTVYHVQRDGKLLEPITIVPHERDGRGVIGVRPMTRRIYRPMPAGDAAVAAVKLPFNITVMQLEGLADLVKRRTTEGIKGPVGMGKLVAEQAGKGVPELVWILMLISVALGMFNLLPFPALDGGRLMFLGYELITRRRPNERIEAVVHTVGLLFLLGVIALVTLRDVVS